MVKLLLLDDHLLFRAMLARLLETDSQFEIVGQYSRSEDALLALTEMSVDIVLLDFDLGQEETGLAFMRQARDRGYAGRIFLVTAGMSDADSVRALGLGACGIFLKHSSPELLMQALHKVLAGETWIDQKCIRALEAAVDPTSAPRQESTLTERESQVLACVLAGSTNKEIAGQLRLSEASVKSALQQLFAKAGVRTRSQLVRVALEERRSAWIGEMG